MRVSTLFAGTAAVLATAVSAQNMTYVTGLLGALQQYNLTSLAMVAQSAANSTEGLALLTALSQGNKTVLAPSNDAFSMVDSSVSSNASLLSMILEYHVINASISPSAVAMFPNHTLTRTLYNSMMLPGNLTEPVVWTNNASSMMNSSSSGNSSMSSNSSMSGNSTSSSMGLHIIQANSSAMVLAGPVMYQNLMVYIIDKVLSLPPTLSELVGQLAPSLAGLISQANLLEPLEQAKGVTVFAPSDSAIAAIASSLSSLNGTVVQTVLGNHVIVGEAVYSPMLSQGNYTSFSGEPFTFSRNSSGLYVMSGMSTAKVVQSDIITANGVVHVIDSVLVNTMNNSAAAASAMSSYSVAATATGSSSANGAIGAATSTSSGAAGSSTSKASSALSRAELPVGAISAAVAVVAGLIGGSMLI